MNEQIDQDEPRQEPIAQPPAEPTIDEAQADQAEPGDSDQSADDSVVSQPAADSVVEQPADDSILAQPAEITTQSVVEAVLFASDEPITPQKLAEIVGAAGVKEIKGHIAQLNEKYQASQCAFRIEAIAGGFQMLTLSDYNVWLRKLVKVRSESKLSAAALETLAIVAYKQPLMRVDVEAIRGVGCGEMIRQLCEKGLVKIVGRAEELGRPLLYGTTKRFLEVFGLNNLRELPQAEQLKPPKQSRENNSEPPE